MSMPADAMNSSAEPLTPEDLERFRAYLDLLARLQVGPGLRDRVDLWGSSSRRCWKPTRR